MSHSNKKIIEYISSRKIFTRPELIKTFAAPRVRKSAKKFRPDHTVVLIDTLLYALLQNQFIVKENGVYTVKDGFLVTGTVRKTRSGNFIIESAVDVIVEDSSASVMDGDKVSVRVTDFRKNAFFAKVIRVVSREEKTFLAKYIKSAGEFFVYELADFPDTFVHVKKERDIPRFTRKDALYAVSFSREALSPPVCNITGVMPYDDESSDLKRISIKYGLPEQYPESAEFYKNVAASELGNRKDYRNEFTVTIDGADAKDFDDALSIREENGNIRLFVHIADVSAYVLKGEWLDAEAERRGTSYYLGNSVIPMLPEALSNDLCSLREGVERLTLSAELLYGSSGALLDAEFNRGLIVVDKRLTYESAERYISSKRSSAIVKMLKDLDSLAGLLNEKRLTEGKLDLNLGDEVIVYKKDRAVDIKYAQRLRSHRVVEECMLSANQAAAKLLRESSSPGLFRVHEKMDGDELDSLLRFIKIYGIKIKKTRKASSAIQNLLELVRGMEYERVINLAVLKSMNQAFYGNEPLGHFGLGFADYTHFTSPIRRYPDLIVHRCIKALMDGSSPPYSSEQLALKGVKTSELERTAQKAERGMVKLKSCRILKDKTGFEFDAHISGVHRHGLFVTLKESPIEGMVPMRLLTDDYYLVKESEFAVVGKRFGKRFTLGDSVRLRLALVDIERLRIDFEII